MQYIVILGAVLNLSAGIIYIKEIIADKAKPNRITFLLWGIAPIIATLASFSEGVRWAVLPVLVTGLVPLSIFFASFLNKESYWKLNSFDYWCGFFSILALFLWWLTKQAELAILFSIISDFFAAIPTLKKIWYYPETEARLSYLLAFFNSITAFFALRLFNFAELAFPIYLLLITTSMSLMLYRQEVKAFLKQINVIK